MKSRSFCRTMVVLAPFLLLGMSKNLFAQRQTPPRTTASKQSHQVKEKPSLKIHLPASKYDVFQVPTKNRSYDYCWLDAHTSLWIFRTAKGSLPPVMMPPRPRYKRLLDRLHKELAERYYPRATVNFEARGRYISLGIGENRTYYTLFDRRGREVAEEDPYHSDHIWSTDGNTKVIAWWGTNGNLKDYAEVRLWHLHPKHRSISLRNNPIRPLFYDGWTWSGHALTPRKLYVLTDAEAVYRGEGMHPEQQRLLLLERDLKKPSARNKQSMIRLPIAGELLFRPSFSPDARSFFCLLAPTSSPYTYLCLGKTARRSMRIVARIPGSDRDRSVYAQWQPDSRRLSFVYGDRMYVLRAD